jgi:predicted DsbA family dithiol-disulfide isomerase
VTAAVTFTVWSDFLCPWCYVAALRIDELHREAGDALAVEWKSFLLRPVAEDRPLDRFTRYTESWARPLQAEPRAGFRTWSGVHAPPSHSMPCAIAGKIVMRAFGAEAFDRFHLELMRMYFAENLTISERSVILDAARAVDLDPAMLDARIESDATDAESEVVADHRDALSRGIAAVPTVVVDDEYLLQGAMTLDQYRKVVARLAS